MKKLGQCVLFLNAKKGNGRNGEGDFIRLNDGTIMFAYTEYTSDGDGDHDIAQISAVFSTDEGESWGGKRVLVPCREEDINVMAVSLLRMANGDIGLFYGRKFYGKAGTRCMDCLLRRSSDEGQSWSEPVSCIKDHEDYFVVENARAVMLKSGRIVMPANLHRMVDGKMTPGILHFFFSDDDGKTFYDSGNRIEYPFPDVNPWGLMETGLIEYEEGKLFAFSRNVHGSQFECFSADHGMTWTTPKPSSKFFSALAPMHLRPLTEDSAIAVYNPIAFYPGMAQPGGEQSKRTPLLAVVLKGEGYQLERAFLDESQIKPFFLEDDENNAYCYASTFAGKDYFLCSYYHSNNTTSFLSSCKITRVAFSDIEKL